MKRNKVLLRVILLFIILTMVTSTACRNKEKKEKEEDKKKVNVYIDVKDRETLDIIRTFLDEYKKEKSNVEISLNSPLGEDKLEEDIVKGSIDLLFISRDRMMDLSKKGLLSDMGEFYDKNKINENFYNIVGSYGRIGEKYFGVGLMPYTIETMYSTEALKKSNIQPPNNIKDLMEVIKKLNSNGTKIPVLLSEGMEIKSIPMAILFSNIADASKIEKSYGCGNNGYSKLDLQPVFDNLNTIVKQGFIKEDSFEAAGEGTVSRLINGDIPMMLTVSAVTKELKEWEELKTSKESKDKEKSQTTEEASDKKTPKKEEAKTEKVAQTEEKPKVEVLKDYNFSETKNNIPVIVNSVISIPANTKNEEAVNDLLDYIYSDESQKKLAEMGYVTGNKAINKKKWTKSPYKDIADHLEKADSNSIFYTFNFPKQFQPHLESAVINILKGKYKGTEWKEVLNNSCK